MKLTNIKNEIRRLLLGSFLIFIIMGITVSDCYASSDAEPQSMPLILDPLFEYVEAPDDLPDLQSRTDYLMDNFWNPFDFNVKTAVDQHALNHAFAVYAQAMPFASEKKVFSSVKNLINKIKGNPVLSYQFTKAAEESLFGPRADFWSDEIYMEFLETLLQDKKIDESKKKKYRDQYALLKGSSLGATFPKMKVTNLLGTETEMNLSRPYTLLEITTPNNEDFRYTNLKLDISSFINEKIDNEELDVNILFLCEKLPDLNYPEKWNIYSSDNIKENLDIRTNPCFYVIDSNKKIIGKNLAVDDAIELLEALMSNRKAKKK